MKMKRILMAFLSACICSLVFCSTALADDTPNVPVVYVDPSIDWSTIGTPIYTYEGDFIIQSYALTEDEIQLAQQLMNPHLDTSLTRHVDPRIHSHSIRNISSATPKSYTWYPSSAWTRNSQYPNESSWPTVSWSVSETYSVSKSLSLQVGVTDSVVSAAIGAEYTKSHTISTSTERTFKVPYGKEGRVKVTYQRPYRTFTCVTTYSYTTPPYSVEETGAGNALGAPYNIVVDLQTRSF